MLRNKIRFRLSPTQILGQESRLLYDSHRGWTEIVIKTHIARLSPTDVLGLRLGSQACGSRVGDYWNWCCVTRSVCQADLDWRLMDSPIVVAVLQPILVQICGRILAGWQ